MNTTKHRIIFFFLLVLAWHLIANANIYPDYLVPSPKNVLDSLFFGFTEAHYVIAILESLKRFIIGYTIAVILGIFSGLAIARYKILDETVGSSLTALQSIPSIAWVPLALLWFGISEAAVLFIIILEAFIPCAIGVKTGVTNIPAVIIKAAQALGAHSLDLYTRVIFPAIIPQLITSLRLSFAFAWRALIAGELFVSGIGIGQNLELGRSLADMSQIISMILIIAILGYIIDNVIFTRIEKSVQSIYSN